MGVDGILFYCKHISNKKKMTAIIILNWNGWRDTIDCITSLYQLEGVEFSLVVVDNGSTNESVEKISSYIHESGIQTVELNEGEVLAQPVKERELVFYQLSKNYGFAKGNNLGLQLMSGQNVDYFWILNNDTEVEPNSLKTLVDFMNNNGQYRACTPQIRYFSDKKKIWNCGGKLCWGFRKYYYADYSNVVFNKDFFDITFVTGCALLIGKSSLEQDNTLFTERFFFGEEDFDLSMRWKANNKKIACCTNSLIYHKVSASTQTRNELPKIYIHYLNRYINIKQHFGRLNYSIWKLVNNIWIFMLLIKKNYSARRAISFLSKLNKESMQRDCVDYDYFSNTFNGTDI